MHKDPKVVSPLVYRVAQSVKVVCVYVCAVCRECAAGNIMQTQRVGGVVYDGV